MLTELAAIPVGGRVMFTELAAIPVGECVIFTELAAIPVGECVMFTELPAIPANECAMVIEDVCISAGRCDNTEPCDGGPIGTYISEGETESPDLAIRCNPALTSVRSDVDINLSLIFSSSAFRFSSTSFRISIAKAFFLSESILASSMKSGLHLMRAYISRLRRCN